MMKKSLSAKDGFRFVRLSQMLHPDKLGEGVVPEDEVARRYRERRPAFLERWRALEAEVGRTVSRKEAWEAIGAVE